MLRPSLPVCGLVCAGPRLCFDAQLQEDSNRTRNPGISPLAHPRDYSGQLQDGPARPSPAADYDSCSSLFYITAHHNSLAFDCYVSYICEMKYTILVRPHKPWFIAIIRPAQSTVPLSLHLLTSNMMQLLNDRYTLVVSKTCFIAKYDTFWIDCYLQF